ncbi:serine--tRNA ligase [Coriobacteriia bacterium Es71-Z0120]|uniref:serine--tRNA ligase n=1 Tax=Parvivirga hydrogeniphila TaxID=2939460 RepID=UPI002260DBEF|nr:serine--tRNA ligase [Parvivirga hydrogeniphila]MCL4078278.1 serine--tRNA ligase [Parvivirga hydrogeniphila]
MLDAKFVRDNIDLVRQALANRGASWDIDRFLELDAERRRLIAKTESRQAARNAASKEIGALMKAGDAAAAEALKEQVRGLNDEIAGLEEALAAVDAATRDLLLTIPNIPHESVPVGPDESANVEVRRWGTPPAFDFEPKAHWDLGPELGIIDFERGVKLAKSRFVVLGRDGARLNRALINFMLEEHAKRGYTEWSLPALANAETLLGTGQLPKFEEDLFKTSEGLYLIPTAEVQLTNLHRDEVLDASALPLKYCAYTPCFREEAGAAGRDTRGMIRVHQFDKVELVKLTTPESSLDELEGMVADAEHILQALGLAYRVVVLCTGDMGFSSAKTYDIEVWLPSYGGYKEISSCSDCWDFQARRASIKYRDPAAFKGSRFVHTLNGSGLAVGRTLVAVLENYQQPDGSVVVPEALRPYMGGQEVIRPAG